MEENWLITFIFTLSFVIIQISAGVAISAEADDSVGINNDIAPVFAGTEDQTCECNSDGDALYMERRYQDFYSVRDFEDYVNKETDVTRKRFFGDGTENEVTMDLNVEAFQRLRLRGRVLRGVGARDTTSLFLGDLASFPLGIAPVPFLKWAFSDGETGVAQAAECEGVPYIVSAFSNTDLEDIAASAPGANLWMETFIFYDRKITQNIVERAEKAGYRAIVITVDQPVHPKLHHGRRDYNVLPEYLRVPNIKNDDFGEDFYQFVFRADLSGHQILQHIELAKGQTFYKTVKVDQTGDVKSSRCLGTFGIDEYFNYLVDPEQSWDDIRWIRKITDLPIVVRGILTGCDAVRAVENGASAIIVSNNGGRTIDTAPAAIEALSEVIEAVNLYPDIQVYLEGGVRLGTDIFKAIALGADGVFIGRPVSWSMLHSGMCGVRQTLRTLRKEFERDMAFMGTKHVSEITSTMVVSQGYYTHRYMPKDFDGRVRAHEDALECPFGYDYDDSITLFDVRDF